jgi:cytochrome c-type biogenesis protein CcmH/NrfG
MTDKIQSVTDAIRKLESEIATGITERSLEETYTVLGNHYNQIKQFDKAITAHKKAIELNPNYYIAWVNLGITYRLIGNFDEAEKSYNKALSIEPNYAELHTSLGVLYTLKNEPHKAIEPLEKAIKLNPQLAVAYGNLALAYAMIGRFEDAENSLNQAITLGYKEGATVRERIISLKARPAYPVTQNSRLKVSDQSNKSLGALENIVTCLTLVAVPVISLLLWFYVIREWFTSLNVSCVVSLWIGVIAYLIWHIFTEKIKDAKTGEIAQISISRKIMWSAVTLSILGGGGIGVGWWTDNYLRDKAIVASVCEEAAKLTTLLPNQTTNSLGKVWVAGAPFSLKSIVEFDTAKSIEEIDTLICIDRKLKGLQTCNYTNGAHITRYQNVWDIVVVDWNTREVRAKNSFVGDEPNSFVGDEPDACPESISGRGIDYYGNDPPSSSINEWLLSIEASK